MHLRRRVSDEFQEMDKSRAAARSRIPAAKHTADHPHGAGAFEYVPHRQPAEYGHGARYMARAYTMGSTHRGTAAHRCIHGGTASDSPHGPCRRYRQCRLYTRCRISRHEAARIYRPTHQGGSAVCWHATRPHDASAARTYVTCPHIHDELAADSDRQHRHMAGRQDYAAYLKQLSSLPGF